MSKNVAVIYKLLYGSTKQYAQWIAEELSATLFETSKVKPAMLMDYDIPALSFSTEQLEKTKIFHLQGGMDYGQFGMVHKAMMAVKKRQVANTPLPERVSDDAMLLETYGGKVDFVNRKNIKPLVDYISAL